MSFISRLGFALIALGIIIEAVAAFPASAAPTATPKGIVVVARLQPTAVLIWDASATVGDLVVAQQTGDAGMRALEADSVDVLASRAPALHAARIEIHAQYAATGIVGAAYNASTFANATPLVRVSADRSAIIAHAAAWARDLRQGRAPAGLTIEVTGSFPQSQ